MLNIVLLTQKIGLLHANQAYNYAIQAIRFTNGSLEYLYVDTVDGFN